MSARSASPTVRILGGREQRTAYAVVKAFWTRKAEMAKQNPWWDGVAPDQVALLGVTLHPGAARYYREAGVVIPAAIQ